jgi:hypothetical protein
MHLNQPKPHHPPSDHQLWVFATLGKGGDIKHIVGPYYTGGGPLSRLLPSGTVIATNLVSKMHYMLLANHHDALHCSSGQLVMVYPPCIGFVKTQLLFTVLRFASSLRISHEG